MTELQRIDSKIYGMAYSASKDWFRRQSRNLSAKMYFWYKPGQIAFWIGEEGLNPNYVKASDTPVSIGRSQRQVCNDICEQARGLPILS